MLADRDRGTRAVVRRLAWSLTALPLIAMGAFAGCGGDSPSGATGTGGSGSGGTGSSSATGGPPASLCIDVQPVNVVPPAGLQVRFRALDCDGNPVRPLASSDVTVFNDEKDVPFGKGGEGDSVSGIGENSNIELYSVLVLDLSNSIHDAGAVDSVIDGAKAFVQETVIKPQASLKHRVTIIAFGRPDQITIEQDFTQDDALLNAKLEALRVAPPRGTTDLYDAYMLALGHVAAAGSGGDTVIERFVVLLTDGTHEAGDEENLRKKALATKHTTDATVYAIGIEGNYDACRLEELSGRGLATMPGAGCRELDACEDVCAGMSCGTDQGIACGTCGAKQICNGAQTCEDACAGMSCGTDQGVSCGMCTGQDYCANNVCKAPCAGMQCGLDKGVVCGTCAAGKGCDAANQCVVCSPGLNFAQAVDYPTGMAPISVAAADLNGDGTPDLAVANQNSNAVSVLLNTGNGTFAVKVDYPTGALSYSVAAADLNGDGKPDLVVAGSNKVSVLLNNGNGTFAAKVDYPTGTGAISVAAADLNGDGKLDLAVANQFGEVSVLLSKCLP